jgi:hypothetical protein
LRMQPKVGGKFHLKLNTDERPIANKYREGKMKRTLKRELKVLEIVKREAIEFSISQGEESIRIHRNIIGKLVEFPCLRPSSSRG